MAAQSTITCSSSVSSLPPPLPKSPPEYPDLYGKRRETAKVQMLEREISFLEDELKSIQGLQPSSRNCKEVVDFVVANSDPMIPTHRKNRKSCRFWKWLCGMPCFNLSWICCCCYSECSCEVTCPKCCCDCTTNVCKNCCKSCLSCFSCLKPTWKCCSCSCPKPRCCEKMSCSKRCCVWQCPSCPDCSCCCQLKCCCCWPKCPKVRLCCGCKKISCNPCCLFF